MYKINNVLLIRSQKVLIKHHKTFILVLLILGICVSLSWQSVHFYHMIQMVNSIKPTIQNVKTPSFTEKDFSMLFGKARQKKKEVIPESSLQLTLISILVGDDPTLSSVIIEGANGVQMVYKIGDVINGGAILEEINADSIVVSFQNKLQKITFPKEKTPNTLIPN